MLVAWRSLIGLLVVAAVAWSPVARGLGRGTLHSAQPMAPGRAVVGADLGFPWLTVGAAYGLPAPVDLRAQVRTAWGHLQRVGVGARFGLLVDEGSALALQVDLDAWLGGPADVRWRIFTGQHDVTLGVGLLYSWLAAEEVVLTVEGRLAALGTRSAPLEPLGGLRPTLAGGPAAAVRVGAEWPVAQALWLALDLGMHLHLAGFDPAVVTPVFSAGLAYSL